MQQKHLVLELRSSFLLDYLTNNNLPLPVSVMPHVFDRSHILQQQHLILELHSSFLLDFLTNNCKLLWSGQRRQEQARLIDPLHNQEDQ